MQIGSDLQVQAITSLFAPAKAKNAESGKQGGGDFSVNISEAARSKLADEQQAVNDTVADNLPVGVKHMLEQMVDDPAFGATYADGYANNVHTAAMSITGLKKG